MQYQIRKRLIRIYQMSLGTQFRDPAVWLNVCGRLPSGTRDGKRRVEVQDAQDVRPEDSVVVRRLSSLKP